MLGVLGLGIYLNKLNTERKKILASSVLPHFRHTTKAPEPVSVINSPQPDNQYEEVGISSNSAEGETFFQKPFHSPTSPGIQAEKKPSLVSEENLKQAQINLYDSDPTIRKNAITTLSLINEPRTITLILNQLNDIDRDVQKSAVFALERLLVQDYIAIQTLGRLRNQSVCQTPTDLVSHSN